MKIDENGYKTLGVYRSWKQWTDGGEVIPK
jgi:hypothetical protein